MTAAHALPPQHDSLLGELADFARPRVRDDVPVMWRAQSTIQIGDDVVVDRVSRSDVAWISSLDGSCTPQQIVESLTIPEAQAARLVRALRAATALDDAALIPALLRWIAQPERDVAAGRHAAALRTYREPEAAVAATSARARTRVGIAGSGPLRAEVSEALLRAGLAQDDAHPGVVILVGAGHPDAPIAIGSETPSRPHLAVAAYGHRATVGPLVVPGRTCCLMCMQMHRRDADPAWPLVAVQWTQALARLPVPVHDPLLLRLAAAHAALMVRTWIDLPHEPDRWLGHVVDVTLPDGLARHRVAPAHPLCACRWA